MNRAKGSSDEVGRHDPGDSGQDWLRKEIGNPWRRKNQCDRHRQAHGDVEKKGGRFFDRSRVPALDQCGANPKINQHPGNGGKQQDHCDDAELTWRNQPGQRNRDRKANGRAEDAIGAAPERGLQGGPRQIAFPVVSAIGHRRGWWGLGRHRLWPVQPARFYGQ